MAQTLHLEVLTPQAAVLQLDVESLKAPAPDGWLGVMPGHSPFQARLLPGEVIFLANGTERTLAQLGGAIIVEDDSVIVLVGVAMPDADLEALERSISEEAEQLAEMEEEAERHFDRVYRQMAQTLSHRRGRTF